LKRGVILEVNTKFVTILTPNGEFLRSRKVKDHYEIGEEIDFFPVNERFTAKKPFFHLEKIRIALASSIAAVLLFFTVFTFYDSQQVYAYMSIDINPSIEAAVDKKLHVISLEAYNEEGKVVLSSLGEWLNQPINSVTKAIIQESRDSGYYEDGAEIIIATVIVEDEGETLERKLNGNVEGLVQSYQKVNVPITVLDSTVQDREVATKKGISTGKYINEIIVAKEKEKLHKESLDDIKETKQLEKEAEKQLDKANEKADLQIDQKKDNKQSGINEQEKAKGNVEKEIKVKVGKDKDDSDDDEKRQEEGRKGPPEKVKEVIKKAKEKQSGNNNNDNKDDDHDDRGENEEDDE
jgi:hypothetical protein